MNNQIEEMAVIGCARTPQAHTAEECAKCDFKNGRCNAYRHAEALYNAGYRKIPKDSVVLSREEQERILTATEKRIKELKKQILQTRKETAEKILKEQYQECKIAEQDVLKARGGNKNDDYYKGFSLGITNTKMHIQELAKQFGVEIKENNNER